MGGFVSLGGALLINDATARLTDVLLEKNKAQGPTAPPERPGQRDRWRQGRHRPERERGSDLPGERDSLAV